MALVKCPECKKEISKSAKSCPGCGRKIASEFSILRVLFLVGWLIVGIPLIMAFAGFLPGIGIGLVGIIILLAAK